MEILGIDVGGSGIKGAPVDVEKGKMLTDRYRIETPQPATPDSVTDTITEIIRHFDWDGPVGMGFPAAVKNERALTATNIDNTWIGTNVSKVMKKKSGCLVHVINDVDAAGLAEMNFGAGRDHEGVVIMVSLGTGIGTSIFINGQQLPNTELGSHLFNEHGVISERLASNAARKNEDLSWIEWGKRVNDYILHLEGLFWPDLFIIGGGVSKYHEFFFPYLAPQCEIVPAEHLNSAGIVGAALSVKIAGLL